MASDCYLSIVAPCYNEEEILQELYRRLKTVCEQVGKSYEIVLVDDGSKDTTWQGMCELAESDPQLVVVKLSRNYGHQMALTAGLSISRGERILIIDADLQDPPEVLPQMLEMMDREHADVVYGQRQRREGETFQKRATAFLFYRIIRHMTELPIPVDTGDFRLISRRALNVLLSMPERHRFIRGMVCWIGFRQVPFLYERARRFAGETKYPFRKMLRFAIDAVTAFSIKPLTMASWIGLFGAATSMLLALWTVWSWLKGGPGLMTGWSSLLVGVSFIGSMQLLVLGIIGEYIGRLYEQSKGRPLYVIEDVKRAQGAVVQNTLESRH